MLAKLIGVLNRVFVHSFDGETLREIDAAHVQVVITSVCDQINAMNPDLTRLQWKGKGHDVFKRMTESAVYQSAGKHIRHTACPIPTAILKAIEVEVGIAVAKNVTITFSAPGSPDAPADDADTGGQPTAPTEE